MSSPPRGRLPTELELRIYRESFPGLQNFSVTGDADPSYDCAGLTISPAAPRRIQPTQQLLAVGGLRALDSFYSQSKFARVEREPDDAAAACVAIFACDGQLTHVALRDRHPGWWESKLGTGIRILHRLSDLAGGRYGDVVGYYASISNSLVES